MPHIEVTFRILGEENYYTTTVQVGDRMLEACALMATRITGRVIRAEQIDLGDDENRDY
jgi:hypothetical protein